MNIAYTVAFIILAVLLSLSVSKEVLAQESPEIWLGPQSTIPLARPIHQMDFMEMFTPNAPWKFAAAHTQVFKLYASYLANTATQNDINTIVADLKRRGIAVGLEVGVLDVNINMVDYRGINIHCGGIGHGIEGYGTPAMAIRLSEMIKNAGGTIKYLDMDEPLFYGHFFKGSPDIQTACCHSTVSEVVNQAIPTLNAYIQEFPDIVIDDIEPVFMVAYPNWQADTYAWVSGINKAMGRPLASMHMDIPWAARPPHVCAQAALAFYQFAKDLQQHGFLGKIGIIYNGTPLDTTDQMWMQDARNHVLILERQFGSHPDQVIFQSWMPNPTHAMPESSPDALTSLVNFYLNR